MSNNYEKCTRGNLWLTRKKIKAFGAIRDTSNLFSGILFLLTLSLTFTLCHSDSASGEPSHSVSEKVLNIITLNQKEDTKNVKETKIKVKTLIHDLRLSYEDIKNISYTVSNLSEWNITNLEIVFNSTNENVLDNVTVNITSDSDSALSINTVTEESVSETECSALSINTVTEESVSETECFNLTVEPKVNGYTLLTVSGLGKFKNMTEVSEGFVRVSVYYSPVLDYVSDIVGWTYFVAWSVSFYPQTILNWRRKSVIGLHFDFLALNTIGFFVYSVFNIGLYFIPEIKRDYFKRHPFGVNPVQLNDVIFSIHAFFACIIQVAQCIIYERGDQRISRTGRTLVGSLTICSILMLILGSSSVIAWIDFLYFLSYIKLFITLIKYIPQAYYNYLRKSTSGWSIGNILLDFTGGTLSICQMFILAFNYNDWGSIFGDPTKFGLGLVSIMFDIFFIIQHYILYKDLDMYQPLPDSPVASHSSSSNSQTHPNYGSTLENVN